MAEENNKAKKEPKKTNSRVASAEAEPGGAPIGSKEELKTFLLGVRDKMTEHTAAPVYAVSAMNFALSQPNIYQLLDNETKEIARDIWLRIKQSGMQLRNPPLLFTPEEDALGTVR